MTNDLLTTDYLIVGQGICGTFLSWNLWKQGKRLLVMDEAQPFTASKVASGVINPVTGRQVVTTWMAETLMDYTWGAYKAIGSDIGEDVIRQANIIAFPPSQQMRDAYDKRIGEANSYIKPIPAVKLADYTNSFYHFFGAAEIDPVWLVDLFPLLDGWRKKLKGDGLLLEERFDEAQLSIGSNHISYKYIQAEKIIFCNGINAFQLPFFKNLPFVFNKGEALIADIPGLPKTNIYKAGNSTIVPWYDGLWWVGSSYENSFDNSLPTPQFKQKKTQELQMNLKLPFTIVDHLASLRPAVAVERRPFVGLHPHLPAVGILNGMGTKGCSLAPWFAEEFCMLLTQQKPIDPLADINRFKRSLGQ
jgi:glycine/D-amino acid oxidase-like deaminating enzyme